MLNDVSRSVSHGSNVQGKFYCDKVKDYSSSRNFKSPEWAGTAWYRFTMPAGTRIPESSPGSHHCGTRATGWFSGVHPTSPGASNNAKYCIAWDGNDCKWSTRGKVTNCGSYFVYYLENTPDSALRYCATN